MLSTLFKKKKKYIFGIPSKYIHSCYYFVNVIYVLILKINKLLILIIYI